MKTVAATIVLIFVSLGCAGTSAQFSAAIPAGVNNIVEDMRGYTQARDWDLNHDGKVDTGELAQKQTEIQLTDALATSIADQKKLTTQDVEAAWKAVEPLWRRYLSTDPLLVGDSESMKIRSDTGDMINKLIAVEKERRAAVGSSPIGFVMGLFGGG